MLEFLKHKIHGRRLVILGFGLEGQSTLKYLQSNKYHGEIIVLDRNKNLPMEGNDNLSSLSFYGGDDYLEKINTQDFIIKSPGVKIESKKSFHTHSQTSLFLDFYQDQIIGITGTKGKSTTSTMIFRVLKEQKKECILVGNIGQPAFDLINQIQKDTFVVYELSAHQLQCVNKSPKYALLLNLMPEHLDFFSNEEAYYLAKLNIIAYQKEAAFSFLSKSSFQTAHRLIKLQPQQHKTQIIDHILYLGHKALLKKEDLLYLIGQHHIENIQAVVELILFLNMDFEKALCSIKSFRPLPHRQESLGKKGEIQFINDSISTIPQSCIQAVKAIGKVDYLILGGYDRGIEYYELLLFLKNSSIKEVFFLGKAGQRMRNEYLASFGQPNFVFSTHEKLQDIRAELLNIKAGNVLLSPAAASYDAFKNFEERGDFFREIFNSI